MRVSSETDKAVTSAGTLPRWLDRLMGPFARRFPVLPTLIRFGFATALSASLSFVLPLALHRFAGLSERSSVAVAFTIAYLVNFAMLRRVVFASDRNWRRDLAYYAVINALFRFTEFLAFNALRSTGVMSYAATLLVVLIVSTIVKFFTYRRLFGGVG